MSYGRDTHEIEISAETPIGKLAAKGVRASDILGIITLAATLTTVYFASGNWSAISAHDMRVTNNDIQVTRAIQRQAQAQRLFACIISQPLDKREHQFADPNSFCNRLATAP